MPWLRQQFQLIRPKIVVCLGRVAAQRMLDPGFSISRDHGKFFDKQGTLFMATYHPAALLRYPDNKPAVFGDFVALRQKITEVCETYLLKRYHRMQGGKAAWSLKNVGTDAAHTASGGVFIAHRQH